MSYAARADNHFPPIAAPGVLALQRALVWLVGASGAIVFIEPSPYELFTLIAAVLFFATGLRLRLVFMPLLLRGLEGEELNFFSTVATFGTAVDVTVAELSIESFFPADDATAAACRAFAPR